MAPLQAVLHLAVQAPVHIHHLLKTAQVGPAGPLLGRDDIPPVMDGMAQLFQALFQSAVADGHGAHGHAPLGSAQVHLNADDIKLFVHLLHDLSVM